MWRFYVEIPVRLKKKGRGQHLDFEMFLLEKSFFRNELQRNKRYLLQG